MGRLTSYDFDNKEILVNEEERLLSSKGYIDKDEMYKIMRHLAEKLFEYEDAEEQGLFLKLPCKAKDRFWELNTANGIPHIYPRVAHSLQHCVYVLERLGKTTFLTKEEAEQALKEMEK